METALFSDTPSYLLPQRSIRHQAGETWWWPPGPAAKQTKCQKGTQLFPLQRQTFTVQGMEQFKFSKEHPTACASQRPSERKCFTSHYKQGTYTGPWSVASISLTIKKSRSWQNHSSLRKGLNNFAYDFHTNILKNLTYFSNFAAQGGFVLLKLLPVRHQQLKDITGYLSYQLVGKLEGKGD